MAGWQISQGKTRNVHPIYPWHIRRLGLNDIGFWRYKPPRPPACASYALRVPRAGISPAASFGSPSRCGTLAVRLWIPVIKAPRGTCTLHVISRFAFACRLKAPVTALRAMPGALVSSPWDCSQRALSEPYVDVSSIRLPASGPSQRFGVEVVDNARFGQQPSP